MSRRRTQSTKWPCAQQRLLIAKNSCQFDQSMMCAKIYMSRDMRFPTMWYVWWAEPQISLCICAAWSEPLLVVWIFYQYLATDQTAFWVSKLKRQLLRLVCVYTCQNATLLEIHAMAHMWTAKTQISLGIWSESLLDTQLILLNFKRSGSNIDGNKWRRNKLLMNFWE